MEVKKILQWTKSRVELEGSRKDHGGRMRYYTRPEWSRMVPDRAKMGVEEARKD